MALTSSPEVDDIVVTLDDIERLGRANLDPVSGAYFNSGAGLDQTLNENQTAYLRYCAPGGRAASNSLFYRRSEQRPKVLSSVSPDKRASSRRLN